MSTVHSATAATTKTLTHVTPHSSCWNNRTVIVLGIIGIGIFIAYRYFTRDDGSTQPPQRRGRFSPTDEHSFGSGAINLSHLAALNPTIVNKQSLPFNHSAAGIFRVNAERIVHHSLGSSVEEVFIECSYKGQPFFTQRMTPGPSLEAYVPEIPYMENMTVKIIHRGLNRVEADLRIDQDMSIYELVPSGRQWKFEPHQYATPKSVRDPYDMRQRDPEAPLSISISSDGQIKFSEARSPGAICSIENQSNTVRILFFQILGIHRNLPPNEVHGLPIVVLPGTTKDLPSGFFRRSWEIAYETVNKASPPENTTLQLLQIRDTVSDPVES
ncbi:MAG TPA: hypothetical protein VMR37_05360 [Rhabdochlamydiaceae bacterium]|nr:hypothetical protein [Rhabdochlamydiaceae bacterium]